VDVEAEAEADVDVEGGVVFIELSTP